MVSANSGPTVSAAASEHGWYIDATRHRQPRTESATRETETQRFARRDAHGTISQQSLISNARFEIGAAPSHERLCVKAKVRTGLRHLQHRRVIVVAQNEIGH